jgi:predicted RecB family nuclease
MMKSLLRADDYVAYRYCPRKAFLLLSDHSVGQPPEYVQVISARAAKNAVRYFAALTSTITSGAGTTAQDIHSGAEIIIRPTLRFQDLEACPDVLLAAKQTAYHGNSKCYEPVVVAGTRRIDDEHRNKLTFIGYVLKQVQQTSPARGLIITEGGDRQSVRLNAPCTSVESVVATLRGWISSSSSATEPGVLLNDHCPYCIFRVECEERARQADDLTLLDRMTPKLLRRYHRKGIFTITQLSYLFRPKRSRQRPRGKSAPFNVELQALAIRTGKIYLQQVPKIIRANVALFLDIEGVPDRGFYYLFGVLVRRDQTTRYHALWADDVEQERTAFESLMSRLNEHLDAPIYHYARYEKQALAVLERRHGIDCDSIRKRLININTCIHGNVYFPVRSNSLKDLGRYLGATWSSPEASGLQSLVWRYRWEESGENHYRDLLIAYNEEDCRALLLLTDELTKIVQSADSTLNNIDFADRPKPQCTEAGGDIHRRLDAILKFAHADHPKNRIALREAAAEGAGTVKTRGAPKGHQAYQRIVPVKVGRTIRVRPKRICPRHKGKVLVKTDHQAQKTLIDLVFSKTGCKKTVTRYVGPKAFCQRCGLYYNPPAINRNYQLFGRGFQAWAIHQRIVLRLPYRVITQCTEDLFGEKTTAASVVNFMKRFAEEYAATERRIMRHILDGPFVHVDETRLSIQGTDHYVWVFTDGPHVFFRLTETRESTIMHEVLSGYGGVVISDFYPGYDGVKCRQQKCWVHLIRDINDDLWKAPAGREFELFVGELRDLIVPVFEAVDRYGMKSWHLRRFLKPVDKFYEAKIIGRAYESEFVVKYQKRFERYRDALFLFLQEDGLPWNNNTGERAIRQLAVQRNISGSFYRKSALHYLLLLGIAQTCRFQEKSFLKFLISGEKDVDRFKATRCKRISKPVFPNRETRLAAQGGSDIKDGDMHEGSGGR